MSKKHDAVLTVAVGRNYGHNQILTSNNWKNFKLKVNNLVQNHASVVATTNGKGVNSDGERQGKREDTFVIIATNPVQTRKFRNNFAKILRHYKQTSSAFAIDRKHKPIFS